MTGYAEVFDVLITAQRRRTQLLIDSLPPDSIQRHNLEAIQDEIDYGLRIPVTAFRGPASS